jgi:hypothetical protein
MLLVIGCALVGVLLVGLIGGLLFHGTLLIGDRRTLERLTSGLVAEQQLQARTHATLRAMHEAARNQLHRDA